MDGAREGKNFFLVGSDYIYPRTCNKIAKPAIARMGAKVVGEEYAPLGHTEFSSIINKIKAAKPECIYSTVVGGSNVAFYKQLRGLDGTRVVLLSTSCRKTRSRASARTTPPATTPAGYFQSLKNPVNEKFVQAFKAKRPGSRDRRSDAVAYNSVHLWKLAVEKAKSFDPDAVIAASALTLEAPEGTVRVHEKNHHVWKKVRVGRARPDGQFDVVWESPELIEPNPFPKL